MSHKAVDEIMLKPMNMIAELYVKTLLLLVDSLHLNSSVENNLPKPCITINTITKLTDSLLLMPCFLQNSVKYIKET